MGAGGGKGVGLGAGTRWREGGLPEEERRGLQEEGGAAMVQYSVCPFTASLWPHRVLPKRAMVLHFTEDDREVLVGDKTGEVKGYPLGDWTAAGGHLLGHFSMLLDMVRL